MTQQYTAWDVLSMSRYSSVEAQAMIELDEARATEDAQHALYDDALDTLIIMYETHQPSATIRLHKIVKEADYQAWQRAKREREAAEARLAQVRAQQ